MRKIKSYIESILSRTSSSSLKLALSQSIIAGLFVLFDFIFSKKFDVQSFGAWKRVLFYLNLFIPVFSFGIPEGFKYWIAKEKISFNKSWSTSFYSIIFLTLILSHILFVIGYIIYDIVWDWMFLFYPISYLGFVYFKMIKYMSINSSKVDLYFRVSLFSSVCVFILVLFCYFTRWYLQFSIISLGLFFYAVVFSLPTLFLINYDDFSFPRYLINCRRLKEILKHGIPLYLASFIGVLSINLDKAIVSYFEDDSVFAIFAVGALEIPIFAMISAAFAQNIYPNLVQFIENGNILQAKQLWLKTTVRISYITYPLILLLMLFSRPLLFFIYTDQYEESLFIFRTYLLIGLLRNNYYGSLIVASGKTKYITLYSLMMLLTNIVLSILLYNVYGIKGIVMGSLFSTLFIQYLQLRHESLVKSYLKDVLLNKKIMLLTIAIFMIYISYLIIDI